MAAKKKTKVKTAKKAVPKAGKKAVAKTAKKVAGKKAPAKTAAVKKTPARAADKAEAEIPEQGSAAPAAKSASPKAAGRIKVTLMKSVHGRLAAHQACAIGLGLRRRHQTVEVEDTPSTRGMINRIRYMLEVEGQ